MVETKIGLLLDCRARLPITNRLPFEGAGLILGVMLAFAALLWHAQKANSAPSGRFACYGHDLGGGQLVIHLNVGPRTVWSRVGDAQASGTDMITSSTNRSIAFGDMKLVRTGTTSRLFDPTFGAFDCKPEIGMKQPKGKRW